MVELGQIGALNCVYFALLAIGVMYALIILVAGELHDFGLHVDLPGDMGGLDAIGGGADVLHGEMDVVSVSPVTIAGFVTAFGAFGLISQGLFDASPAQSLVWASIGGLIVGVASHLAFIWFFIKPQGSSEFTQRDVVNATAEVITPIPEGGLGEIALVARGSRVTMSARSEDGRPIRRGEHVAVARVLGSVAYVAAPASSAPAPSVPSDEGDAS